MTFKKYWENINLTKKEWREKWSPGKKNCPKMRILFFGPNQFFQANSAKQLPGENCRGPQKHNLSKQLNRQNCHILPCVPLPERWPEPWAPRENVGAVLCVSFRYHARRPGATYSVNQGNLGDIRTTPLQQWMGRPCEGVLLDWHDCRDQASFFIITHCAVKMNSWKNENLPWASTP